MYLKSLNLQNFRNYDKASFDFGKKTLIVGPNTSGKTNIIEAIYLLSNGKSFRGEKDNQAIKFGGELSRIKGELDGKTLEVMLTQGIVEGKVTLPKKYLLNGVAKRRADFVGNFQTVLFSPIDLEIVIGAPSKRRAFMDEVLEQVDYDYRLAISEYEKGLRQRNSLLEITRKTGERDIKQFDYWDTLLIKYGNVITAKREALVAFLNSAEKVIFDFATIYDKNVISYERLLQYQEDELLAGVTLVGPHRDDISFHMYDNKRQTTHDVKLFGSRGQQRLVVLQLKILELMFIEKKGERPLLLLDDIFSELDEDHIMLILDKLSSHNTVITTTHEEFVPKKILAKMEVINLR